MTELFVSQSGRDDGVGSRQDPLRTLSAVNERFLPPGSRIWLRAGEVHKGSLRFMRSRGAPDSPILVAPYDGELAQIEAGREDAIVIYNSAGLHFSSLRLVGTAENETSGVRAYADRLEKERLSFLRFENMEITGFGGHGVWIAAQAGLPGFDDIRFTRVHSHHNRLSGILVSGDVGRSDDEYTHSRVVVDYCTADHNTGQAGLAQHSGSGILLCDIDEATIEHCVAHHNGRLSTAGKCGPAGIWACLCRRAVIQYNHSFANATSSPTDGGGFGLDGGTVDSVLQFNRSHDNHGPGYLLAQFYGPRPFARNIVRENLSENDARRNDYGAIHLWAPDGYAMRDVTIERNWIKVEASSFGRPRGLVVQGPTRGLVVRGNKWEHQVPVAIELESEQERFVFADNEVRGGGAVIWQGMRYDDLSRWLAVQSPGEGSQGAAL